MPLLVRLAQARDVQLHAAWKFGIAAGKDDRSARELCRQAGAIKLRADFSSSIQSTEIVGEFAFVGREDRRLAQEIEQGFRIVVEGRQGIGVQNKGRLARERGAKILISTDAHRTTELDLLSRKVNAALARRPLALAS